MLIRTAPNAWEMGDGRKERRVVRCCASFPGRRNVDRTVAPVAPAAPVGTSERPNEATTARPVKAIRRADLFKFPYRPTSLFAIRDLQVVTLLIRLAWCWCWCRCTMKIFAYHCLCSTHLLTTPYALPHLPVRAAPAQDRARILPLPPLRAASRADDDEDGGEDDDEREEEAGQNARALAETENTKARADEGSAARAPAVEDHGRSGGPQGRARRGVGSGAGQQDLANVAPTHVSGGPITIPPSISDHATTGNTATTTITTATPSAAPARDVDPRGGISSGPGADESTSATAPAPSTQVASYSSSSPSSRSSPYYPSVLSPSLRPARRPIVVRREDGYEKRRVWRCARCGLPVGYEIVPEQQQQQQTAGGAVIAGSAGAGETPAAAPDGDRGGKVMYLLEGALVGMDQLRRGSGGSSGGGDRSV